MVHELTIYFGYKCESLFINECAFLNYNPSMTMKHSLLESISKPLINSFSGAMYRGSEDFLLVKNPENYSKSFPEGSQLDNHLINLGLCFQLMVDAYVHMTSFCR